MTYKTYSRQDYRIRKIDYCALKGEWLKDTFNSFITEHDKILVHRSNESSSKHYRVKSWKPISVGNNSRTHRWGTFKSYLGLSVFADRVTMSEKQNILDNLFQDLGDVSKNDFSTNHFMVIDDGKHGLVLSSMSMSSDMNSVIFKFSCQEKI
jgi:hypothetical protein